ncbi:sulfatase-like hydrolase/transferase [Helicobacter sp. 11S03491-1]|uniref:phosphoethanolamine transferase n=1 Tax=Helicobacter sp. 11S03491-1 TaxID=1476196 RepID=UPI000BA6F3F5|nr:sulfatase-like hydrolase/transferase [Helicobacter sp. 11S03491-1]PAF41106.1 hypothetical protein BKH45_08245 [Helicobacter sp. 11S03491-1]
MKKISQIFSYSFSYHWIIFIFSVVLVGLYNDSFWLKIYSYAMNNDGDGLFFLGIVFVSYVFILALAIELISLKISAKWIMSVLFVIAGLSQYYMKSYDITINKMIITSLFQTHLSEAKEFISVGLIGVLIGYILLPIGCLWIIRFKPILSFVYGFYNKISIIGFYIIMIIGIYFWQGGNIIFAFKSSKIIIYTLNPIAPIRSGIDYALDISQPKPEFTHVGLDAKLDNFHKKIFVLVIGESARGANYFLNGYSRDTNPYTKKLDSLVNFTNFYSCGVITAISIPCMLTNYTHQTYKKRDQSLYIDNILDITQRVGYETYWISNNGGPCIGDVCDRIKHISYYNDGRLDAAMLEEIKNTIKNAQNNSFIVVNLHGSHGANYYKRYSKDFEIFTPVCENQELQKCKQQDIVNAYDNSIVYTDYFIYQIVTMLKTKKNFSVGMWYLSDHGESLGEYGQYMHGGMPYFLAPDVQKHIPSMIWFGEGFEEDYKKSVAKKDKLLNQDYLFHTLLHLLDIQTSAYQKNLDITQ